MYALHKLQKNTWAIEACMRNKIRLFLCQFQGDFIVQFLDLAEDELNKQIDDLNPVRLESLLELALRTSSSSTDPYKDNVCVQLIPFGIGDQMRNIMAIETPFEHTVILTKNFITKKCIRFTAPSIQIYVKYICS